jgi:hypothetical protein
VSYEGLGAPQPTVGLRADEPYTPSNRAGAEQPMPPGVISDVEAGAAKAPAFNNGVYQKALEIIPSSNEVKTNIELLIQQQQGQSGGEGQQNQPQQGDQQQNQDQKNQEGKDQKDQKDQEQDQKEGKQKQQSQKYKPRPFNGKELSEGDVKKILGELKQQEEKIRAEYNRKDVKEQPRDKDW